MARMKCDRCPVTKARNAVTKHTISLGTTRWSLALCEECGRRLEREMFGWGRLGNQLDDAPDTSRYGPDYIAAHRRAAEQRSSQREEPRPVPKPTPTTERPLGLPLSASQWRFTDHAQERMGERQVDALAVLHAVTSPTLVRPGDAPNTRILEARGVKVVVNSFTNEILTVASTLAT